MNRYILPVIHYLDHATSLEQADLAFAVGADGVFVISHGENADPMLHLAAKAIKARHPGKLVGLNLETFTPLTALEHVIEHGLDMVWVDNPGIASQGIEPIAHEVRQRLQGLSAAPLYFAAVAFKYQPADTDPPAAARMAASLGVIPTTSGDATGQPPTVEKIRSMREAIGLTSPLALASGMSPENVRDFTPFATHFLVSTNVSVGEYHFDKTRLARFVELVKASPMQPGIEV